MKSLRTTLGVTLLASILPFCGCSDAYKQRYIAKNVLGLSDQEVELAGRAKLVPYDDLKFAVKNSRTRYTIEISSDKWEILGFGTGFSGSNELTLDSFAGVPSPSGSTKTFSNKKDRGTKLLVMFLNEDGTRSEIYREK